MDKYLELFLVFSKIGGFTFGGGYAMLPILQKEIVEKRNWATNEELTDYFAIGQCTPGVIAVNTATFIGQKQKGILGGIIATLGVAFPSIIIISIIAAFINNFSEIVWVQQAFAGIRVCVSILIITTIMKLFKTTVIDKYTLGIFLVIFFVSIFTDISPVIFVIMAGAVGVMIKYFVGKYDTKKKVGE
ncbi:MAG: chromate transporter [Oscillospiraceae bacterium]